MKKENPPSPALADTPPPPYYAVIFSTIRTEGENGYGEMAEKMADIAATMPGYLGAESTRNEIGITVSYWKDLESIKNWKYQAEHVYARHYGTGGLISILPLTGGQKVERDYGLKAIEKF
ncbi:MAG: antibiotic biosynthesis monooxygenase [Saprospiraceae bacterium]